MSKSAPNLAELLKQSHIEDHEDVVRAANSLLKQSKGDLEAQHTKIVALLKLDRFEDALHAFETGGERLKEKAGLEYAYTLYKSGKPQQAAEIARQGADRGHRHVEAQASYRTEDFRRAAELYQQLASSLEDDAEADIRINSSAVDAQLEWADQGHLVKKKKPGREDLEAFETAYNAACGSIAREELGQGEVLLKRARDLCNSLEELSEQEKQAELLPITVQQVYVLSRQGKTEEAENLAKSIDTSTVPDVSTRHIAQVNRVAASSTQANPYLVQRLIAKDTDSLKPDYPFHYQTNILKQNKFAADLQSLKFDGAADSTAATLRKQSSPSVDAFYNSLSVVNAAAHAKSRTGKEALKYILPLLEQRPDDIGLVMTIIQLYVLTGNHGSAIALCEGFLNRLEQSGKAADLEVRFAPGVVGTLVSLYQGSGRTVQRQTELAKAATHWRRKTKERSTGVLHLLKTAGSVLIDSPEPQHQQLAKDIFTELHERDEQDRYAAAGLLAASPRQSSASRTSTLTALDRLVAGIDVDALERSGVAQPPPSATAAVTTRKRPADDTKPRKPKKMRKSRMPKDYDPNKKPDPERWLPLRDRSTYRPKGRKGKARQALLSQGAAPAGESEGSRPATPGADVVRAKQGGGGTGAGAKKKKGKSGKR